MPSKQKRRITKRNGAKAAGAKSPQGIQTSAMNALRHGLTSKTLVLANECPDKFNQLLQSYIEKFQPQDGVEMNLVDEMVAARWRQQRVWMVQTAATDLQMDKQVEEFASSPYPVTEPTRIAMAFHAMANQEKALDLLMRYETSYSRMHDRAMKALFRLRAEQNLRNDPKPVHPAPHGPSETMSVQKVEVRASDRLTNSPVPSVRVNSFVPDSGNNINQPRPSERQTKPSEPTETNQAITYVLDKPQNDKLKSKPQLEI